MKAVGYATKAKRHGRPKMVLLGDIVGEDDDARREGGLRGVRIANARGGEGFVAVSAEARKKFWLDRARTAAIAKHTNAFKINEDVVIPLERLGDYTDGIERINIELSIAQQADAVRRARRVPRGADARARSGAPDSEVAAAAGPARREGRRGARAGRGSARALAGSRRPPRRDVFPALQDHSLVVSWKRELKAPLEEIFAGLAFAPVRRALHRASTGEVLHSRVFVALHMHAGDGNVHTNIPVNSDDYAMLQEANAAVARIMALARALGGVISGEHGIGITKLEYLTDGRARAVRRLQAAGRSATAASTPASCCARRAARRPHQRLHAELQRCSARRA